MNAKLKGLLERVQSWPESDQAELADMLEHIEVRHSGVYHATVEELKAIEESERSGIASDRDVETAFKTFRRA